MSVLIHCFTRRACAGLFVLLSVLLVYLVTLSLTAPPPARAAGTTYYVRDGASGSGCTSWADACDSLQDALASAAIGDEIWVAAGVYYPDEGSGQSDNDPDSTFQLVEGVDIYGGFPASGTPTMDDRDWENNVTVLSGDIGEDDITDASGVVTNLSNIIGSNAYHVVIGADNATLDGVTITAGQAEGGNPQGFGGGMYNDNSSPTLSNVTFAGNQADFGGGMLNRGDSSGSNPTLTNVIFAGNQATEYGGGMYNWESNPTLTNVILSGNQAINQDGGGILNDTSSLTLTNVTLAGNQAGNNGGGMANETSSAPTIQNSIIWGNGTSGDQVYNDGTSTPTYNYSLVEDADLTVQGTGNLDGTSATANFVAPQLPSSAPTTAGDYRLKPGSSAIDAGNNNADLDADGSGTDTISDVATDLDGGPRIVGSAVDLGAYEAGPNLVLHKAVNTTNPTPGGTITYTLTLSNDGEVNTSTALVSDTLPAGLSFVNGSLTIDGSTQSDPTFPTLADNVSVVTSTTTIVRFAAQLDADLLAGTVITNTATVTCTEDTTPINSSVAIIVAGPAIATSITPSASSVEVGDTITYTYHVTNTGNVTLDPVTATDDRLGTVTLSSGSLAPGASAIGTLSHTVVEGDLPGPLANEVTATGTPSTGGSNVTDTASASVTLTSSPDIAASITPSASSAEVGDTITYTYRVTNTGNVTLDPVTATDDRLGDVTLSSATLAPGATANGTHSYVVLTSDLPGPLANTVIVTGTSPVDDKVDDTDSASVNLSSVVSTAPPTITIGLATGVQTRSATLHATVNPNGLDTTVMFAWGEESGGPHPHAQAVTEPFSGTQVQNASLSISNLTPDTTYYYTATASNAKGSATSAEESFTTPAVTTGPAYGSTPPVGSLLDVGTVTVGTSNTASLEVREVGSADLVVDLAEPALSGTGADHFSVEAPASFPVTIANGSGERVTLTVACTPQQVGVHTATLTLETNDAAQPTVIYPLRCTGEASGGTSDLKLSHAVKGNIKTVKVGDTLTFIITYTNEGDGTAREVVIKVVLPDGTVFWFEEALTAGGWDCENDDPAGTECSYPVGDVAPGESGNAELPLRVVSIPEGGTININPTATDADGTVTTSEPEGGEGDDQVTVEEGTFTIYLPLIRR